jgi:hypothetical protein
MYAYILLKQLSITTPTYGNLTGFSENGCKRAAIAVSNENVEAAMNWVFEHMEDPGESIHTHLSCVYEIVHVYCIYDHDNV